MRVQASSALQHTKLSLIAHSSGELVYTIPVNVDGPITSFWLDKSSFPSGIAQFTLFNADNEPLNERIAFIKNADQMQLAIKTPKAVYKSREHVQLTLDAHDSAGSPIAANFSAAVIDENKVPTDETAESTIFSNLLLSSDIKGYIEKPNYYFSKDSDDVNKALDNLMLIQGYRRFEWQSLLNTVNTKPIYADAELGTTASGRIAVLQGGKLPSTNILLNTVNIKPAFAAEGVSTTISGLVTTLTHKPLPNANVLLISLNARLNKLTTTDDNGRFKFDSLMFADSAKIAIQARDEKHSDKVIIRIDTLPGVNIGPKPIAADASIIKLILKKAEDDGYTVNLTGPNILKQVDIKAAKIKVEETATQGMTKLMDEQSADKILTMTEPENYPTLEHFLQGRMGSISVGMDPITGYKRLMSSGEI
ncbi:carboxypeptidase-like regulatory domain-containing protein [Mucilaginibacter humi]|uniref:carboxypeptidase-like regulatory domain-containing protein n=1 Tax=Mucilaginibacter humi TaxID=2732510 RepID=UPI001C2DFDC5|nr:carboxypeptidase-like regulatory domain-containing protein [Mucilaginibacter humi]